MQLLATEGILYVSSAGKHLTRPKDSLLWEAQRMVGYRTTHWSQGSLLIIYLTSGFLPLPSFRHPD